MNILKFCNVPDILHQECTVLLNEKKFFLILQYVYESTKTKNKLHETVSLIQISLESIHQDRTNHYEMDIYQVIYKIQRCIYISKILAKPNY